MCVSALVRCSGKAPLVAHNVGQFTAAMRGNPICFNRKRVNDDDCLCAVDFGTTARGNAMHASYDPNMEAWELVIPTTN